MKRILTSLALATTLTVAATLSGCTTATYVDDGNIAELYKNGQYMAVFFPERWDTGFNGMGFEKANRHVASFNQKQFNRLAEYAGGAENIMPVVLNPLYKTINYLPAASSKVYEEDIKNNPFATALSATFMNYLVELDPDTGENAANIAPDKRFIDESKCRLPQRFDEIALTDFQAEMFIRYGYCAADGTVYDILSPDDLIGKTLYSHNFNMTICGVYSTEVPLEEYRQYDGENYTGKERETAFAMAESTDLTPAALAIVAKGFYDNYARLTSATYQPAKGESINGMEIAAMRAALIKANGDEEEDRELLKSLQYSTKKTFRRTRYAVSIKTRFSYMNA